MNKNRFKQLLESTMGNVKPLISETVRSIPNVNLNELEYNVTSEGSGDMPRTNIFKSVTKGNLNNEVTINIIPSQFHHGEYITVEFMGNLMIDSASQYPNDNTVYYGRKNNSSYFELKLENFTELITVNIKGNVDGGKGRINLNLSGSSIKEE